MATTSIPHLDEADLEGLNVTATQIIDMLDQVILDSRSGKVWAAPKATVLPPDGRYIMATLAAMDNPPLVATKSLVLNARNSDIGLPQINGIVTLLQGQTGVPLATVDGNWITAVRTAGLSALAAKYMANPDATSLGFVGTGTQARSHLRLFQQMFPLERIKISGRGQANIDALGAVAGELGLTAEVCATPQEAVEAVDLVVTSVTHTGVDGPFLRADWLAAGCFAAIVDLGVPWHKDSFAALDRLIIDDLEQEAAMPGKLANPEDVKGDLTGLVTGSVAGRKGAQERTAFVFRGHALGDLALAALVYQLHAARA
tara:strand:- start:1 stop:945 length:945 start_codon:yes stop_codon:yes gene_type:complete